MTAKFFVDTNVLLYAASKATDEQSKRQAARALLAAPGHCFVRPSAAGVLRGCGHQTAFAHDSR